MNINQGEIWLVKFYPQIGSEISKLRPAVVVSHNDIGKLPLKTIVPITDWKENYKNYLWMIQIEDNTTNGLSKLSAIDCFQIKNFTHERFEKKIGQIDIQMLNTIHDTITKTFNPLYQLSY